MTSRFGRPLFLALLLLLPATLLTETVLYGQSSLFLQDEWVAGKSRLRMYTIYAYDFLFDRPAVARDRLNLGSYFGFQEVISRDSFHPRELRFEFELPEDAYLELTMNRDSRAYLGLRFSTLPQRPGFLFRANSDGAWSARWAHGDLNLGVGKHSAIIRDGEIQIDDRKINDGEMRFTDGRIGFNAGARGAFIDKVEVRAERETRVFRFANRHGFAQILWIHFFALLAVGSLLGARLRGRLFTSRAGDFHWIGFSLAVSFVVGSWLAYDRFSYSGLVPEGFMENDTHTIGVDPQVHDFESLRDLIFRRWSRAVGATIVDAQALSARGFPYDDMSKAPVACEQTPNACVSRSPITNKAKDSLRMVVIGSSQTAGVGASTLENTWFVRLHRGLAQSMPKGSSLQSFNLAIPGAHAKKLSADYLTRAEALDADLVVIDLGSNDWILDEFVTSLRKILEENHAHHRRTLLVQEANSFECTLIPHDDLDELLPKHRAMQKLGDEFGVSTLNLHGYLVGAAREERGRLWWDCVHMSDFAQDLTARFLLPAATKALLSAPK